jgi:hypothetical protein
LEHQSLVELIILGTNFIVMLDTITFTVMEIFVAMIIFIHTEVQLSRLL